MAEAMDKPAWLLDFKKRISLIEVIDGCFDESCSCKTCVRLRGIAADLGRMFKVPSPEGK